MNNNEISTLIEKVKNWYGKPVKHFKGDYYIVLDVSRDCEDINKYYVNYRALYGDCEVWHREITDFLSPCNKEEKEKYGQDFRFEPVTFKSVR